MTKFMEDSVAFSCVPENQERQIELDIIGNLSQEQV